MAVFGNTLGRALGVGLAGASLLLALSPRPAVALPDLISEVFDVSVRRGNVEAGDVAEGCAGGTSNRLLLEYSLRSRNIGEDHLIMGAPNCPSCAANPGAVCGNPLYVCSPAHGHAHFDSFSKSVLLDANNNIVAQSQKSGFCLLDYECATPQFSCSFQGISAGCADVYERGLPCQYMDITDADLPNGLYTLRVTMDPENLIPEASEANNSTDTLVQITTDATACPRGTASDTPLAIPDNGFISSAAVVAATGWVTRVRLQGLEIAHPSVGDLEVHLRSPMGTDVVVMNRVCGTTDNVSLDLEDGAATAISCPATDGGAHRPSNPMTAFVGEEGHGTWVLTVYDRSTGQTGTLTGWSLEVCTEPSCESYSLFSAPGLPAAIADLSTTTSTITVPPGTGIVARAEVMNLRGQHTYVGDLEIELRSPGGRTATLFDRQCAAYHNFDLSLSSFAPTAVPCPPTDGLPHLPASSFTTFIGERSEGDWTVVVHDLGPGDVGSLTQWGLRICPVVAAAASCPPTPAVGCKQARRSQLTMADGIDAQDRGFRWKWQGADTAVADLGDPTSISGYAACVYTDGNLVQSLPVASSGTCHGHSCWRPVSGRGFRYRNRSANKAGVDQVTLRSGSSSSRMDVRAKGPQLVTALPMGTTAAVQVQLVRSDSALCWESTFYPPALTSTGLVFRDRLP